MRDRDEVVPLRFTWDEEADAGYLHLTGVGRGEAVVQRIVEVEGPGEVVLDLDAEGRVLGIEFLGDALLPPGLSGV